MSKAAFTDTNPFINVACSDDLSVASFQEWIYTKVVNPTAVLTISNAINERQKKMFDENVGKLEYRLRRTAEQSKQLGMFEFTVRMETAIREQVLAMLESLKMQKTGPRVNVDSIQARVEQYLSVWT